MLRVARGLQAFDLAFEQHNVALEQVQRSVKFNRVCNSSGVRVAPETRKHAPETRKHTPFPRTQAGAAAAGSPGGGGGRKEISAMDDLTFDLNFDPATAAQVPSPRLVLPASADLYPYTNVPTPT